MEIGFICMYGGTTAPNGFLVCDGSAVSRTTYSELFSSIGTSYGAGDGSTTFNLPDLTGKVVIGVSSSYTLGDTGGEESHVLLDTELPAHVHTVPAHGHSNTIKATTPVFSHSITQPMFQYNPPSGSQKGSTSIYSKGQKSTSTQTSAASRSTNVAVTAHAAANCTMAGSVTDCAAFNSGSAGSGTAHSNMQPYVSLNFIIYVGEQ